jgi:hypothetical protein
MESICTLTSAFDNDIINAAEAVKLKAAKEREADEKNN